MKPASFLFYLVIGWFAQIHMASADSLESDDFVQWLQGSDAAPVIISLSTAEKQNHSSATGDRYRNGEWLNLEDYIEEAQAALVDDMGWVNLNDVILFKHVPAIAKRISAAEFQQLKRSSSVKQVYRDQWNPLSLHSSGQRIGLDQIIPQVTGGKGVSVAVIDSGVASEHAFFGNRVVDGACFSNLNTCPGRKNAAMGIEAAQPCSGHEDCFHGTHVAGIVAGYNDSMNGVAPASNLLAINVFSVSEGQPRAADSDIMRALEWVYDRAEKHKVAAVNLSLGSGTYTTYCDDSPIKAYIDLLWSKGIVTVVATGNSGNTQSVASPACVSSAVAVGSLDADNKVSSFSNSSTSVDILAPGSDIYSATIRQNYIKSSGTSMAAPQVAGAVAVLRAQFPSATPEQIVAALQQGPHIKDQRNGLTQSRLYMPHSISWLEQITNAATPSPPDSATSDSDGSCHVRMEGISISSEATDCNDEPGAIQW